MTTVVQVPELTTGVACSAQVLTPSGDTTGATDDTNFYDAVAALDGSGSNPGGGCIYLMADQSTPFYTAEGWNLPAQVVSGESGDGPVCLEGVGMPVLMPAADSAAATGTVGSGSLSSLSGITLYNHRTNTYGGGPVHQPCSYVKNLLLDGTNTTGAQVGLDVGDGNYFLYDNVIVQNYANDGAIGFYQANRAFWTEKGTFRVKTFNNKFNAVVDVNGGQTSHEYNLYDLFIMALEDQCNFVCQGGSNMSGRGLYVYGNYSPTSQGSGGGPPKTITGPLGVGTIPCSILAFVDSGHVYFTPIHVKVEQNTDQGDGNPPYPIYMDNAIDDSAPYIHACSGIIETGSSGQQSNVNNAECSFSGRMSSNALPGWPPNGGMNMGSGVGFPAPSGGVATNIPSSGNPWQNLGTDAIVYINGGSVTGVRVNELSRALGQGDNDYWLPAGSTIQFFYTSAPTVTIGPATALD